MRLIKGSIQIFEMKKTTKFWVIAVSILGLGSIVFATLKNEFLAKDSNYLAYPETNRIYTILITDASGNKTELKKLKGEWIYNGQFKARPNAIENLLDAISKIQIRYRPPRAAELAILTSLKSEGILVEIFDKNEKLIKAYTLGGTTQDERGTYASLKGRDELFVTELPGWSGNLRFRYNLIGDDWRDKNIFSSKPSEIKAISVKYPKNTDLSFTLLKKGNQYELLESFSQKTRKADWQKSMAYLRQFNDLTAEAFENNNPLKDSIIQKVPFCEIQLVNEKGDTTVVEFLPVNSEKELRYFAHLQSGDLLLVQHRVFGKIFATPADF